MSIFHVGHNRETTASMFHAIAVRVATKFISLEFRFVSFSSELKHRIRNRNCLDGMGMRN